MKSRKDESIPLTDGEGVSSIDELTRQPVAHPYRKGIICLIVLAIILVIAVAVGVTRSLDKDDDSSDAGNPYISAETQAGVTQLIQKGMSAELSSFAYDRIAYLTDTFGPRFSGSQALEDVIDEIVKMATADGLTVEKQGPVAVPHWVRGREYATLFGPYRNKSLPIIGLGMSNKTYGADGLPGPVTAPVIVVRSFDELDQQGVAGNVNGKIVVYNQPFTTYGSTVAYRSQGAARAYAYGAVAALVRAVTPYSMQTPHTGSSNTAPIAAASITPEDAMQMQRMQDRGQTLSVELYMDNELLPDGDSWNTIITLPGTQYPNEYVVIGGHIDSWDNAEGALDDLDGGLIAWEALRLMHLINIKPKRTILGVFWTNEENGSKGAQYFYNQALAKDILKNMSIALESDSGVFLHYGIGFTGSDKARSILQELTTLFEPIGGALIQPNGGGVDIGPLCDAGVPCSSFESLDFRATANDNNMCSAVLKTMTNSQASSVYGGYFWYHHTTADTVDKLSAYQIQQSSTAMAIWAYSIANLPTLLPR